MQRRKFFTPRPGRPREHVAQWAVAVRRAARYPGPGYDRVPRNRTSMSPETPITAASPAGRRILLVDDNRDAADSLALLLGLEGHDVRVAYAGRPAIEVAHEFRPEIAVLDLGLPDLSGYDVARLLRQD